MSLVTVVVPALLVGIGFWMALLATIWVEDLSGPVLNLVLNLGTEIMGAGLIYLVFDQFIGSRERREAKKREVIARMRSRVHDVAIAAAEELRDRGWLNDGSLQGTHLAFANLQRANLARADLEGAHLMAANLQMAILSGANLRRADLRSAYLQRARLRNTYLQRADLSWAYLRAADLSWANLQGALLESADLQSVNLGHTSFDGTTLLPDDTKWTPQTDLARFTDPDHPKFWRSDDPASPAYEPKEQE